ncbi:MAG: sugar ABC transporter permease, partial [Vallitaleaceae bacterium]|nr:sugar ABC transporter permease [Vallitaleaceae bacterium]
IFRSMFSLDGFVNAVLTNLGFMNSQINWLTHTWTARAVIIIALVWRWTGYNMLFYLAGLQNIEYSIYEAAKIDGASPFQLLTKITIPILKPVILLTAIMSTNGTLQLFDESFNLTNGGPANTTMTMSHYIYRVSFQNSPKFGYAAALAFVILILVAVLALLQMKVGDKR